MLTLISISTQLKAQTFIDSIDSNIIYDSYNWEPNRPNAYYMGFHGYYIATAEIIPVRTDLFNKLISDVSIPTVDLNPIYTLAWVAFMRNWMFTSLSYSAAYIDKVELDSLTSRLSQYSLAARFGYNVIKKPNAVISPYIGFRYSKFKHLTSLNDKRISLDNYLSVRDIDLRVSQFSTMIGINSTFLISDILNIGFYASYLIDLHNHPIIRTRENRITNVIQNPMGNFVIGIGFGMGFNNFYE